MFTFGLTELILMLPHVALLLLAANANNVNVFNFVRKKNSHPKGILVC